MDALTLVSVAGAHADVSDVASLHDVVQRLHRLLDGREGVEPMAYMRAEIREAARNRSNMGTYIAGRRCSRAADVADSPSQSRRYAGGAISTKLVRPGVPTRTLRLSPFWLMTPNSSADLPERWMLIGEFGSRAAHTCAMR